MNPSRFDFAEAARRRLSDKSDKLLDERGPIGYLGRLLNDAELSRLHRRHCMMPQTEGPRHKQAYTLAVTL